MAVTLVAASVAVATDLRWRRIPNVVVAATVVAGLSLAATGATGTSFRGALIGSVLGLLLMLPGHLLGGTGAGDVKLMMALGSVLGPQRIVMAFLYSAIAGGVLALIFALRGRRLGRTIRNIERLVLQPGEARQAIEAREAGNRFPYGPAVAAGSVLAALGL